MKKTLRGCEVEIDGRSISMRINKPLGGVFSISDKVYNYIKKGYTGIIMLPDCIQIIKRETIPFKREEVKSKFAGCKPWYRYWFVIDRPKQEQLTMEV